jgi:hypothetical protein
MYSSALPPNAELTQWALRDLKREFKKKRFGDSASHSGEVWRYLARL